MLRNILEFWTKKPQKRTWAALPIGYLLFLQLLTGIPKADIIREADGPEFLERFAEELFGYPYWAQDLSHLPLFAVLAWLWSWYLGGPKAGTKWAVAAAWISFTYAVLNEMGQYFVPKRFPSVGDLIMNIIGVTIGLLAHAKLFKAKNRETHSK
ncbi:MAG: hypothetical protein CMI26_08200 [Opitutae bacterium]|nr:hypothetical protein [Opitutae bacterium]|tara:strand:- start:13527 stop:13988 length:462 start_codon:yes stop_codon:yes gene_type:complete